MPDVPLIHWDAPGPYTVAFSTRVGGVSEGPYASLNLGRTTNDDPVRVVENRRRLCAAIGADLVAARPDSRTDDGGELPTDRPDRGFEDAVEQAPPAGVREHERGRLTVDPGDGDR